MKNAIIHVGWSLFFILMISCDRGSEPSDSDSDTGTDTNSSGDTDADTDTDVDTDSQTNTDTDAVQNIDIRYTWHTFYYGDAYDIAEFDDGALVVVGTTYQGWQGPAGQAPLNGFVDYNDLAVLKLGPSGEYLWHTFLGDTGPEWGYSVLVDSAGDIVIAGRAGAAFDGPEGQSPQYPYTGEYDNFILKLSADGEYLWHAFFGAADSEQTAAIALDGDGNIYLAGTSSSSWFIDGLPAPLNAHGGSQDVYVVKLDAAGKYQWHTFQGGGGDEQIEAIALDSSGAVYLVGGACDQPRLSWNGPAGQAPINPLSFQSEGFALKLDSNGVYQWHTYFGGRRSEKAYALAAMDDAVYITGTSIWPWNGPHAELPINPPTQTYEAFVLKLDPDGAYRWHGFYGGQSRDDALGIAVNENGVYVAGSSEGVWAGPEGQAALNGYAGDRDGFVMNLGTDGAFRWHSFHGGMGFDTSACLLTGKDGGIRIVGGSQKAWEGFDGENPLNDHSGSWESTGNKDFYVLSIMDDSIYLDSNSVTDQDVDLEGWNCHPAFFGSGDGCDCGCGTPDPDCVDAGCESDGCYDEGCFFCHFNDGSHMPCIAPDEGNTCPTGHFDIFIYYGEIVCTTSQACANPPTEHTVGIEFEYACPFKGHVCCVQFCEI